MTKKKTGKEVEDLEEDFNDVVVKTPPTPKEPSEFELKVEKYIGKYWRNTTHITGFGTVNGKATREQLTAFISRCNPESNLDEWLTTTDEFTAEVKKKLKRKPENN